LTISPRSERVGNLGDHRLDELGRLVTRQTDFLIDRLGELSAGNRMPGHDALLFQEG
jgi:hypothetical protein